MWPSLQPITKQEFKQIFFPASMHAIGHVAANLSFAAVAISLTHTVKTLEPAFNVVLSRALLGTVTPAPVIATLVPIMVRLHGLYWNMPASQLAVRWYSAGCPTDMLLMDMLLAVQALRSCLEIIT